MKQETPVASPDANRASGWRHHRGRSAVLFLALVVLGGLFLRLPHLDPLIRHGDFIAYWSAGRVFLHQGNPYDERDLLPVQKTVDRKEDWALMVWQPPWVLAFAALPGAFDFWTARWVWMAVNLVLLAVSSEFFWRWGGGPPEHAWIALAAGIFFIPCTLTLWWGQVSLLVLAGLALFLWAAEQRRDWLAGAALLLLAIKAHTVYLLFPLIVLQALRERRWRLLGSAVLTLGLATLLPFLFNPQVDWRMALAAGGPLGYRVNTFSFWLRESTGILSLQFLPTGLGFLLGLAWWWRRRAGFDWRRHLVPLLLVSTFTMCYGWLYDLAILLPAVIVILARVVTTHFGLRSALLISGLVVLQSIFTGLLLPMNPFTAGWWMPLAVALLYFGAVTAPPLRLFPDEAPRPGASGGGRGE